MSNNRPTTALMFPKGTYKSTPFFFRGEDEHHEPEFIDHEMRYAQLLYDKVRNELEAEKKEYDNIQKALNKKDSYSVALASALGDGTTPTEESARLRSNIDELNEKIDQYESYISEIKGYQHPSLMTSMQKEKAYYHAEIEHLRIEISEGISAINEGKKEIASIVSTDQFTKCHIIRSELMAFSRLVNKLKYETSILFSSNSQKGPVLKPRPTQDTSTLLLSILLEKKTNALLEKEATQRLKYFSTIRAKMTAKTMIDQIEEMNQTLCSYNGEPLNIQEFRDHFVGSLETSREMPTKREIATSRKTSRSNNIKTHSYQRPSSAFGRRE